MHEAASQGCSRRGSGVGVSCVETMLQPSACLSVTSHHLPYPGICNCTRADAMEAVGRCGQSRDISKARFQSVLVPVPSSNLSSSSAADLGDGRSPLHASAWSPQPRSAACLVRPRLLVTVLGEGKRGNCCGQSCLLRSVSPDAFQLTT